MGKKIRVQRRGRGSPTFRAPPKRGVGVPVGYPSVPTDGAVSGTVEGLMHDLNRPIARIRLADGTEFYVPAVEGMYVGQPITMGADAPIAIGNILPLGRIPDGAVVCNIELSPGDGGRLARSSGSYASLVTHLPDKTLVRLPSGKAVRFHNNCLATIGVVAGAGRTERPFFKAGKKHYLARAKGHVYPRTRGVAMVAAAHPFGGGSHQHPGKPTTVSRGAPPGRKVGLIAARASGRGKGRRRRRSRKS
ncbi:TPA: 50S ribosomal protein L2 [Candidatus Bathyarchaeota archaeon]|nr:50S ribosomal protein L2 [Candidatus Bathyarchaeota archaeon]